MGGGGEGPGDPDPSEGQRQETDLLICKRNNTSVVKVFLFIFLVSSGPLSESPVR